MMHSSSNYDPFYRLVLHRPRGELLKKQKTKINELLENIRENML